MRQILLFFGLLLITFIPAQENFAGWRQFLNGEHNNTTINNVITDGENLYVNGSYTFHATFDGISLPEDLSSNSLLTKLDNSGKSVWINTISGDGFDSFYDIAFDKNGDIIATGWFSSKTDISLNGQVIIPADDLWNVKSVVAKFSKTDGSLSWIKYWKSEEFATSNAVKLAVDKDNNVYIGGYYSSDFTVDGVQINFNKTSGEDVFFLKFDSAGNVLWGKTIETVSNGGWSRTKSLTANENGVFYAFEYDNAVKIGNDTVPHLGGGYSLALVKFGFDGNVQNYMNFGSSSGSQTVNQLISDKNNDLLLGGYYTQGSGFSIAGFQPQGYGSQDGFVAKLDSNLGLKWFKSMGGEYLDRVFNVYTNDSGDIFVGGGFDSYTDFSYDGQKVIDSRDPNALSMFQLYIDSSGNFRKIMALHGYDPDTSISNNASVVLNDGSVITGGRFTGRAYFEQNGELINTEDHSMGFVMKWDTRFLMVNNEISNDKIFVYPNPFDDVLNLSLKSKQNIQVNIYDLSGKNVYSSSSVKDGKIVLNHLKPGVYLMRIQTADASQTVKLIKK